MSKVVRVAVVGFTPFERASFDTFFRLAPRREPAYVMVDLLRESEVVVANADNAERLADVAQRGRLPRTLSIGSAAPAGVASHLPRPINMMLVMRELDNMVLRQQALSPSIQRVLDDFAVITRTFDGSVDPRAEAAQAAASAKPAAAPVEPLLQPVVGTAQSAATEPAPLAGKPRRRRGLDHILVVDRNDQALRFMALHLERFGFQAALARSGAEAMERVAHKHYEFVFLEADLADIDGYLTCQAIKRNARPGHRPAPTVVMMTRRTDATELARSGLAGSDACVRKPLREEDLLRVVGQREVQGNAYAETVEGGTTAF